MSQSVLESQNIEEISGKNVVNMIKKNKITCLLSLLVILPSLAVFIYLYFFASPVYISETRFAIRSQQGSANLDAISSFLKISSPSGNDAYIVYDYIYSQSMLKKVENKLSLIGIYSDKKYDFWFRLKDNPTQSELLNFWEWLVVASYDPDTGILTLKTKGFTPEMAQNICQSVLSYCEELVNSLNERARTDAMLKANQEVARAEKRILNAQKTMQEYQASKVILDPQAVASGLYSIVNNLESEITKTTSELAESMTFLSSNSPRVIALKNRLEVLNKQLIVEKQRLASETENDTSLNTIIGSFQILVLEEEFAQKQLSSAMTSLEAARIQSEEKTIYLNSYESPTLPDESLYPRPFYFTFIYLLTSLLILALLSLIIAAIREHLGF